MSDTHLRHRVCSSIPVPESDLLIHAGDACLRGTGAEVIAFFDWFSSLKAKHKIFVAGNHDWLFEKNPDVARALVPRGIIYLQDSLVEIEGVTIYGSPWQPEFMNWAFNLPRGHRLREKWNKIPDKVDVLVTHGPPLTVLDRNLDGEHVGCGDLRDVVSKRVKPRLHVFGHIHLGYGTLALGNTLYVNASVCGEDYLPFNDPIVLDLDPGTKAMPQVIHSGTSKKPMSTPMMTNRRPLWDGL